MTSRIFGDGALLPQLDDLNRAWFTAGVVTIQCCADCDGLQHPPDEVCSHCQGTRLGWRESAGLGRVESVAVVHQAVHPALAEGLPYAVVVVSLDDAAGVHVIGNVVNRAAGDVEIGQALRVVFDEGEGGLKVPQWEVV